MSTRKCPPQSWFRSPTEEAVIRKISHEERLANKRGQAARPPLPRSQITQTLKSAPTATPAANKAITNITILIHNIKNPDKKELLTEDVVELLTTPFELAEYKNAITAAMIKGTKRTVESESDGKNVQSG